MNKYLGLALIIGLSLILRVYTSSYLFPQLFQESFLFAELLGIPVNIPLWFIYFFGVLNILLLYITSRNFFSNTQALLLSFLYCVSPWVIYTEASGSLYVFFLTLILVIFYGYLNLSKNKVLGLSLILVGSLVLVYSSILMWFVVLPILLFLLLNHIIPQFAAGINGSYKNFPKDTQSDLLRNSSIFQFRKFKIILVAFFLLLLPLLALVFFNKAGFLNIKNQEITLFSDIGLINAVNTFRGETLQTKYDLIARIAENRYIYLAKHTLFNFLKHLSPAFYFTSEVKMFERSFSPPIFLGFLIPFILGLSFWGRIIKLYKWKILSLLFLVLPSVLSKDSPNMVRLLLLSPLIFLTIVFGFQRIYEYPKKVSKLLIFIIITLVILQGLVTVADIAIREATRLHL